MGAPGGTQRDRIIARNADQNDMSTGFNRGGPAIPRQGVAGGTQRDRIIARNTDWNDMSTGLVRR